MSNNKLDKVSTAAAIILDNLDDDVVALFGQAIIVGTIAVDGWKNETAAQREMVRVALDYLSNPAKYHFEEVQYIQ